MQNAAHRIKNNIRSRFHKYSYTVRINRSSVNRYINRYNGINIKRYSNKYICIIYYHGLLGEFPIYGEFPTFLFLNFHLSQPQNFYRLFAYRIVNLFSFLIALNQPEVRIGYSFLAINFLVVTPRYIFCVKRELEVRVF